MRINGILENLNLEPIEIDQSEINAFSVLADYLSKSYDEKYSGLMKRIAQDGKDRGSVVVSVEDVDDLEHIIQIIDDDIIDGSVASTDVRKSLSVLDNFVSDLDITMLSEKETGRERPPLLAQGEMEELYHWVDKEGPFRMGSEFREFLFTFADNWDRGIHSLKNAAVRMHGIVYSRLPGAMVRAGQWFARDQFGSIYHFLKDKGYDVEQNLKELEKSLEDDLDSDRPTGTKSEKRKTALRLMTQAYKNIRSNLSKEEDAFIRNKREDIIDMIIDGLPAEEAFDEVLNKLNGAVSESDDERGPHTSYDMSKDAVLNRLYRFIKSVRFVVDDDMRERLVVPVLKQISSNDPAVFDSAREFLLNYLKTPESSGRHQAIASDLIDEINQVTSRK